MALTIKLQSPNYNNAGSGNQILLPVEPVGDTVGGVRAPTPLPGGRLMGFPLGMSARIVQLAGVATQTNAVTDNGLNDILELRDKLLATVRHPTRASASAPSGGWSGEAASGNWGTASLPAAEQDSGQNRAKGKARLILDKKYNAGEVNQFIYGYVTSVTFAGWTPGMRASKLLPFVITFAEADIVVNL